ncbi:MAG: GNAT family N-acetyltransferase, partial [Bacteroidales bacterium]|nr:GNAT family N-acetyltransferase [Bacteroidales bacterium]
TIPEELPDRFKRIAAIVEKRCNVHVKPITRRMVRKENYGARIFALINECYKSLYNFTVLPENMAEKYLGFYLSILDLDYVSLVENENGELVAFGITMPSIVRALQKSRGKFFPFGWWWLLRSMFWHREEGIEMLLIGVRPDYQNTGINSLLFADLFEKFRKAGVKWAETNAVLEDNLKNQGQWKDFETECVKRRRSYIKKLDYPGKD